MKLDLDEMEASLGFMADWKLLIKEVRHLREVAEAANEWVDYLSAQGMGMDLISALKTLDEARRE